MCRPIRAAMLAAFSATALHAQEGDAAAGAEHFARQCVACHVVRTPEGETLAGRAAMTGPNLWGVAGRVPGSLPGFVYGASLERYGQTGAVWEAGNFIAYVQAPTDFLRAALGDRRARARMAYEVRDAAAARDLWAYLAQFGPE